MIAVISIVYIVRCIIMRIVGITVRIVCNIRILLGIDVYCPAQSMLGKIA